MASARLSSLSASSVSFSSRTASAAAIRLAYRFPLSTDETKRGFIPASEPISYQLNSCPLHFSMRSSDDVIRPMNSIIWDTLIIFRSFADTAANSAMPILVGDVSGALPLYGSS